MSVSAHLDFEISFKAGAPKTIVSVIKTFLDNGWSLIDYGKVCYLPIGDVDDFAWQREAVGIGEKEPSQKLLSIFDEKEMAGERVGVVLTRQPSVIAGSFVFSNSETFWMSLSIDRQTVDTVDDLELDLFNASPDQFGFPVKVDIDFESMEGRRHTDFKLYLTEIMRTFEGTAIEIKKVKYGECG